MTYHASTLVTVYDFLCLTQPLAYIISPFWHIVPQPVLIKPKHITYYSISVINSLLTNFHPTG